MMEQQNEERKLAQEQSDEKQRMVEELYLKDYENRIKFMNQQQDHVKELREKELMMSRENTSNIGIDIGQQQNIFNRESSASKIGEEAQKLEQLR